MKKDIQFEPHIWWNWNAIVHNKKIYAIASNYNMLFSIDTENGQYEIIGELPYENLSREGLINSFIRVKNEIILGACSAKYNYKFDMGKKRIECLNDFEYGRATASFTCIVNWDEELYLVTVPMYYGSGINVYSYNNMRLIKSYDISNQTSNKGGCNKRFSAAQPCIISDSVFCVSCDVGILYEITKDNLKVHIIEHCEKGIIDFGGIENTGCCVSMDNKVIIYDINNMKVKKCFTVDIPTTQFRKRIVIDNKILFFSIYNNSILIVDLCSTEICLETINKYFNIYLSNNIQFICGYEKQLFFKDGEILIIYDISKQYYRTVNLYCDYSQIRYNMFKSLVDRKDEILCEHKDWCTLEFFCDIVMHNEGKYEF